MKLFVWCNPYPVDYGSSMAIAVAESVDEARDLLAAGKGYSYGEYEEERSAGLAVTLKTAPTRVIDCPCAEWHEWSE